MSLTLEREGWLCVLGQDLERVFRTSVGGWDAGGPCPASFVTSRLLTLPSWVLIVS